LDSPETEVIEGWYPYWSFKIGSSLAPSVEKCKEQYQKIIISLDKGDWVARHVIGE
jgi:hypothetical protein